MEIPALSTKALKQNYYENRKKFNEGSELQSKEFSDGSGLEDYDFDARMYDPQIGRFMQIDPLADFSEDLSPYSYAENNPILFNDPTGLLSDSAHPQDLKPVEVVAYTPAKPTPSPTVNAGPAPTTSSIAVTAAVATTEAAEAGTITVTGLSSIPVVGIFVTIAWAAYDVSHTVHPPPTGIIPGDIGSGVPRPNINQDVLNRIAAAAAATTLMAKQVDDHLKGGKKNKRDKNFGIKDGKFWKWWHRSGKQGLDLTKETIKEAYDTWEKLGKPVPK